MSSQISGTALLYLEKTEFLASSTRTHKPTANASLEEVPLELFAGAGEVPPAPDWNLLQEWNLAALEASAAEVRQTDQAHRENLVQLAQLRADRRDLLERFKIGHRALRDSFTGTYGPKSLPLMGLDAPPARASLAAREQLREVVSRMRDGELAKSLPEPIAGQTPIDLETLSAAREADIVLYDKTSAEFKRTRKRVDESRLARKEARARNRRVYSNVARVQEGLYRLAGLGDLADRIRFTVRSPNKKKEEPAPQTPEPDGQSTDPSPQPEEEPAQQGV